jgi:hypothetical protein
MRDLTKFYGPLTVLVAVWSFLPLYDTVSYTTDLGSHFTYEYGTLWQMVGNGNGSIATLGLAFLAALTVLLAIATLGTERIAIPITIASLGVLVMVMLLMKPATGNHPPELADTGVGAVALAGCAVVVALTHVAMVMASNQRARVVAESIALAEADADE